MYLYSVLVREVEHHCIKQFRQEYHKARRAGDTDHMRGWKVSFKRGALESIRRRLQEVRKRVVTTSKETAIVLVATDAVDKYVATYPTMQSGPRGQSGYSGHGYDAGKEFGSKVSLAKGGLSGGKTKTLKE